MNKKNKRYKLDWLGAVIPSVIIIIWLCIPSALNVPAYVFPSLENIIYGFIDFAFGNYNLNIYSGTLFVHLTASIVRVLSGFSIAAALGLTFGYISGNIIVFYRLVNPIINLFRAIPGIAWLPISIVWFGIGNGQSVFLISLAAFFPVYTNTCHGVITIDEDLTAVSKVYGTGPIQNFKYVVFPLSLQDAAVGLRVGLGLSWAYLVLGEMTGVNKGIGAVMQDARMLGQIHIIIICMLVIALTATIFDKLMNCFLKIYVS
jgi:NitT/TauT family transport system permease protein